MFREPLEIGTESARINRWIDSPPIFGSAMSVRQPEPFASRKGRKVRQGTRCEPRSEHPIDTAGGVCEVGLAFSELARLKASSVTANER